jgi:hypothetical protein
MYWVRVSQLKNDLIAGRLSERRAFPYFLAILVVDTALINSSLGFPGDFDPSLISLAHVVVPLAIVVTATILLYRVNGGASGHSFFIRYFPILWVVGIRFLPLGIAVLGMWFYFQFNAAEYSPSWRDVALWNALYALYYWRVWVHFHDVRARLVTT